MRITNLHCSGEGEEEEEGAVHASRKNVLWPMRGTEGMGYREAGTSTIQDGEGSPMSNIAKGRTGRTAQETGKGARAKGRRGRATTIASTSGMDEERIETQVARWTGTGKMRTEPGTNTHVANGMTG